MKHETDGHAPGSPLGDRVVEAIEEQDWIDRTSRGLARATDRLAVRGSFGRLAANFLHGTWLGHPLHSVLTDVPLGAWTATAALDAVDAIRGRDDESGAAEGALAVGIAGAVGAAVTGLADWRQVDPPARRTATVHGALNGIALAAQIGSLALRRAGRRPAGRLLGTLGFAIAAGSAYLGGHLVYRERIGVDHADRRQEPQEWVPTIRDEELAPGAPRTVALEDPEQQVALVRRGGEIHALANRCSHLGGPLGEGQVDGDGLTCPWHGSRFHLETGAVLDGPATAPQPVLLARVHQGRIEVRRPPEGGKQVRGE